MRTASPKRKSSSRNVDNREHRDSEKSGKFSSSSRLQDRKKREEDYEDESDSDLTEEEDEDEVEVDIKKPEKENKTSKQPTKNLPKATSTTSIGRSPKSVDTVNGRDNKSKKLEKSTKTSKKQTSIFRDILCYSIALIAIVLGVIFAPIIISEELKDVIPGYIRNIFEGFEGNSRFDYSKIFDNKIKELKTQFPNQTTRFWKILKTRGLAHLNDKHPKQPLVLLMGAPPSAHNVIDCIAWKLAETLDPENENLGYIDGTEFTRHGGHEAKKIMDETLEGLFQKGDRSALILHLELLPPPSPILFYSYCDNDNAKFKHAGIIFTVHLPDEPDMSLTPAEQEGTVEKYLSDVAWSKYPYDHDAVAALLSRIADTVALVNGETDEVINLHCQKHAS